LQLELDYKNSAWSSKDSELNNYKNELLLRESELNTKAEILEKKEFELNKSFIDKCKDYINNYFK
jgi:hypothetical protein